jgi:hypothetical protein
MNSKIFSIIFFVILFSITLGTPLAHAKSITVEDHRVDFEIEGGNVLSIILDSDFIELIVDIESNNDGILQISIPRDLLDAKFDTKDDIFFVIVNGFDTEYVEITADPNTRTLLIPFFAGDSQIEIIGTEALSVGLDKIITQPSIEIPSWVKSNAGWWSNGQIRDADFVSGIQYLITEGIMTIPHTTSGTSSSQEIPNWIRNNAGWWADGKITDSDFVSGIQYLISNGIMII